MEDKDIEKLIKRMELVFPTREQFDKRFNAVDEKFAVIDERFDAVDEKFNAVDERFNVVNDRFNIIDEKFAVIDERFDAVDERFNIVDEKFAVIDKKFSLVHETMVTREDFYSFQKEMNAHFEGIEKDLKSVVRIHNLDEEMSTVYNRLNTLEQKIGIVAQ
jgi:hypothetical protein